MKHESKKSLLPHIHTHFVLSTCLVYYLLRRDELMDGQAIIMKDQEPKLQDPVGHPHHCCEVFRVSKYL